VCGCVYLFVDAVTLEPFEMSSRNVFGARHGPRLRRTQKWLHSCAMRRAGADLTSPMFWFASASLILDISLEVVNESSLCAWSHLIQSAVDPLMAAYSSTVIGTLAVDWWAVTAYIWYSEEGPGRAAAPPSLLLAVPNVTAHPSTASVLTLYNSMW